MKCWWGRCEQGVVKGILHHVTVYRIQWPTRCGQCHLLLRLSSASFACQACSAWQVDCGHLIPNAGCTTGRYDAALFLDEVAVKGLMKVHTLPKMPNAERKCDVFV